MRPDETGVVTPEYIAAFNALAAKDEWPAYTPDMIKPFYDEGLTPEDAWSEEVYAASVSQ